MPATGTTTFSDPGDYQAGFRGATINLVFTGPGIFAARLTSVSLPHLELFSMQESLPRIAYVSLAPKSVSFAFPMVSKTPVRWGGLEMKPDDLMSHGVGEHMHQCTKGASEWGIISVDPKFFACSSQALAGSEILPPGVGKVLRPPRANIVELKRLHTKACRLAETDARAVKHREVARAIEQDIIYELVTCLAADVGYGDTAKRCHCASIMSRLENVLAAKHDRKMLMPELCKAIGVAERTLRNCCSDVLGMTPNQYLRLRRLNLVHLALQYADPVTATISEIAENYGFTEFGRLAGSYRTIFGETPSATLHRARHNADKGLQFAENA
jgi:AraC-like DNA-binding protein